MNITLEQQYNYLNWRRRVTQIYKQQMLNESLQGSQSGAVNGYVPAGESSTKDKIYKLKAIDKETGHYPFLFYYESDGSYDIATQNQGYLKYRWQFGQAASIVSIQSSRNTKSCSSFTKGSFHVRNYDWNYDSAPEVVVRIPRGIDKQGHERFASLNIARLDMSNKDLIDGDNKWNPQFDMLESTVMDGINEYGLSYNTNVVPVGDNPNRPFGPYEGDNPIVKYNITWNTNSDAPAFFIRCMLRIVLDYCKTVEDAILVIQNNSWFAARNPTQSFIEEFHLMIHDAKNDTIVVEFVENSVVIHRWNNGVYAGCTDTNLNIQNSEIKPMMTNFYLSKWSGNVAKLNMNISQDARDVTLTKYPAGIERYYEMQEDYNSVMDVASAFKVIQKAWYRKAYRYDRDGRAPSLSASNCWWSEFINDYSKDFPQLGDFNVRSDETQKAMFAQFIMPMLAQQAFDEDTKFKTEDIRPGKDVALPTWQTVHSTVYDKTGANNMFTMSIQTQEDETHTYTFDLPKAQI